MKNEDNLKEKISTLEAEVSRLSGHIDVIGVALLCIIVHLIFGNWYLSILVYVVFAIYEYVEKRKNRTPKSDWLPK
ncbi:MAG: hypothetical protein ACI9WS_003085 [Paraglaciecola psychrophila]|jgi:hypothetical protein